MFSTCGLNGLLGTLYLLFSTITGLETFTGLLEDSQLQRLSYFSIFSFLQLLDWRPSLDFLGTLNYRDCLIFLSSLFYNYWIGDLHWTSWGLSTTETVLFFYLLFSTITGLETFTGLLEDSQLQRLSYFSIFSFLQLLDWRPSLDFLRTLNYRDCLIFLSSLFYNYWIGDLHWTFWGLSTTETVLFFYLLFSTTTGLETFTGLLGDSQLQRLSYFSIFSFLQLLDWRPSLDFLGTLNYRDCLIFLSSLFYNYWIGDLHWTSWGLSTTETVLFFYLLFSTITGLETFTGLFGDSQLQRLSYFSIFSFLQLLDWRPSLDFLGTLNYRDCLIFLSSLFYNYWIGDLHWTSWGLSTTETVLFFYLLFSTITGLETFTGLFGDSQLQRLSYFSIFSFLQLLDWRPSLDFLGTLNYRDCLIFLSSLFYNYWIGDLHWTSWGLSTTETVLFFYLLFSTITGLETFTGLLGDSQLQRLS